MDNSFEYRKALREERLAERKRQEQIRRVRLVSTVISVLVIFAATISANTLIARAGEEEGPAYHKYYTQVYVSSGDSVWRIADSYMNDCYESVSDLVSEIISINQLDSDGTIYYGTTIVVPYYATEVLMNGSH